MSDQNLMTEDVVKLLVLVALVTGIFHGVCCENGIENESQELLIARAMDAFSESDEVGKASIRTLAKTLTEAVQDESFHKLCNMFMFS